jgi:hypothetical protein
MFEVKANVSFKYAKVTPSGKYYSVYGVQFDDFPGGPDKVMRAKAYRQDGKIGEPLKADTIMIVEKQVPVPRVPDGTLDYKTMLLQKEMFAEELDFM